MLQYGVAVPFGDSERDVVTARVPVEAMLQAARRMTEPTPPADLGLAAALTDTLLTDTLLSDTLLSDTLLSNQGRSSSSGLHPRSVLERGAWQQQAREEDFGDEESPSSGFVAGGALAASSLAGRASVSGVAGVGPATPAPPLAAQFGLQDLIDEGPEPRNWHLWARTHGLWIGVAVLALGLGASFAVRWSAPGPSAVGQQGSQLGSQQVGQP